MSANLRNQTEAALRTLHLAASVFHHTRDGVMITALDGRILAVNRAFTTITGYSENEVLGQNPRILKSGRQSPEFYKAMWESIRMHGFWQGEAWNRRKDGTHFAEDITVTMVPDEHGQPSHYVAVLSDITTVSEKRRWLEQRSYFDTLTGLPNRVLLMERLTSAVEESKSSGIEVAVAFLDLDGFKEVNDRFGHAAGDNVLVQTAGRLATTLRKSDTLARFGGDEFVAVLPDLKDGLLLSVLMKRLLQACSVPLNLGDVSVSVSASIGVALFPSDAASPEELLRAADAAMYIAKREGRNRYHACRPSASPALKLPQ
jgi:diguanylate cyclase (GGDEF)-like protein/PAS domain S-box-containing protein